jgi:regulator of protease activity HflC (stomatin/prohibitin superfamily)
VKGEDNFNLAEVEFMYALLIIVPLVLMLFFASIKMITQYERGILFRMGKVREAKGPGVLIKIPLIDRLVRVDLRTVTMDVPAQDIITKDNVSVRVSAVVYFKVVDPVKATIEVEDYQVATSQLAQTTLRSICGQDELDHMLSERDAINHKMQMILDHETEPWGVKISKVEVKEIDLPESMQRAMAKQAEAERERRASIINADAELQSATKLCEAASLIDQHPAAIQLRYLQTIREIGVSDKNSTLIPIPMELLKNFLPK